MAQSVVANGPDAARIARLEELMETYRVIEEFRHRLLRDIADLVQAASGESEAVAHDRGLVDRSAAGG